MSKPFNSVNFDKEENQQILLDAFDWDHNYFDIRINNLLLNDINRNIVFSDGRSLLTVFLVNCEGRFHENVFKIVKLLLSKGANPNGSSLPTPLMILIRDAKSKFSYDKTIASKIKVLSINIALPLLKKLIYILLLYGADRACIQAEIALKKETDEKEYAEKIEQLCNDFANDVPYGSLKSLCLKVIIHNFDLFKERLNLLPQPLLDIVKEVNE